MARQKTLSSKSNRKKFLEVYQQDKATIETACAAVGVSPATFYRYAYSPDADQEFLDRVKEIEAENRAKRAARIVEEAEKGLNELVKEGVPSAIYFALKTRGGWHEKQEVEVSVKDYTVDFGQ